MPYFQILFLNTKKNIELLHTYSKETAFLPL